ncbi:hypothetical protein PIB30_061599 [Stylosanthes scabra]|uniref:Uncharacterized protein n=1 Tax=Stylosanthes scabra TaxID=79078 RepID=A0ABU6UNA9_9FABA|nr:hypothetical protein [Stylosanthes scabra]
MVRYEPTFTWISHSGQNGSWKLDAMMVLEVTGSSPSFKIRRGSAESTQKGGTGRFGVAATFACREPCLDSFQVVVRLREDNRRIGSGNRYYEIEKREKYEDSDERADSDLAVVKMRRYHFDEGSFIHPPYSVRFGLDRLYELPIESPLALRCRDYSKRKDPSLQRSGSPLSPSKMAHPTQGCQGHEGVRPLKSWELIMPSEGWMCKGDDVEGKRVSEGVPKGEDEAKEIEGEGRNEVEEEEEKEDSEELRRQPEYSPVHSSQVFAQHPSNDMNPSLLMVIVNRATIFLAFGHPPIGLS